MEPNTDMLGKFMVSMMKAVADNRTEDKPKPKRRDWSPREHHRAPSSDRKGKGRGKGQGHPRGRGRDNSHQRERSPLRGDSAREPRPSQETQGNAHTHDLLNKILL